MSKTVSDLRKEYPNLIKQIEDNVLTELGIIGDKGNKGFTEEETSILTDEQKSLIRLQAKNTAGIKR